YIEVRSLDVNPFSPIGITADQVRFLDLFLTWAVLSPSDQMDDAELECWRDNWNRVVLDGRNPELLLKIGCNGERLTVQEWGQRVFAELEQVAQAMDAAAGNDSYQQTILRLKTWIDDPELTLSAQLLNQIKQQKGIGRVGMDLANAHASAIKERDFAFYSQHEFEQEVEASNSRQTEIEQSDTLSFDDFLDDYFADLK
ncbi:glutamate--cysteine ligase, partial [Photobacterium sp. OFAV2-7]|nr:glutamate--cysteine ligase [Photobacterium sp. OFAV2-7]